MPLSCGWDDMNAAFTSHEEPERATVTGLAPPVRGRRAVIVAGSPPGTPGRTNALRVHRIGDAVES
jgi:hypothetical protein